MSSSVVFPVQPGDIISARMWNDLMARLDDLESKVGGIVIPTNLVEVPRLFGSSLDGARTSLTLPTVGLNVGAVFDSAGDLVNPNASGVGVRLVIGQSPSPRIRVPLGSSVDLLLAAATSGGGPGTPGAPSIIRFEDIGGAALTQSPAGTQVVIVGERFDPVPANNQVFFAPANAPQNRISVTPDLAIVTRLTVRVPTTLPGTPTNSVDPALAVRVTIETAAAGPSAAMDYGITAAPALSDPQITNITPLVGNLGGTLTISGTSLQSPEGTIQVGFVQAAEPIGADFPAGRSAVATVVNATTVTVTVPNTAEMLSLLPAFPQPGSLEIVLRRGDGRLSNRFTKQLRRQS